MFPPGGMGPGELHDLLDQPGFEQGLTPVERDHRGVVGVPAIQEVLNGFARGPRRHGLGSMRAHPAQIGPVHAVGAAEIALFGDGQNEMAEP